MQAFLSIAATSTANWVYSDFLLSPHVKALEQFSIRYTDLAFSTNIGEKYSESL